MGTPNFVSATQVVRVGDARYRAAMTEHWNAPLIPHGGMVTAIAARAMADHLALPEQSLRSVSVLFAGQVLGGELDVAVQVIRMGRSISSWPDGPPASEHLTVG